MATLKNTTIDDTGFGAVTSNVVNATNFNWYLDNVLLNFANMPTVNCIGDGVYSIIANNNNCSDTLASFVSCIVSDVNEISNTGLNFYPNPAKENITIEIAPNETLKTITLYDVTGKQLKQTFANSNKVILNLSNLSKGYYFINIQTRQSQYISKIVLE